MRKGLFEFTIARPCEREKATCEISYKDEILAEISQETDQLLLEIYPTKKNNWWEISLLDLQEALEVGKKFLIEREPFVTKHSLRFDVIDQTEELQGMAYCIPDEYAFVYETGYVPKSAALLIFDTLIIEFDSKTKHFTSLDAYTNIKQWQYLEKITLPNISKKGSLVLQNWFEDPKEDRVSFDFMPEFEYSQEGIVKIKFSNEPDSACQFYQFSREGIVGLSGTKLASIIFQNVNLDRSIKL